MIIRILNWELKGLKSLLKTMKCIKSQSQLNKYKDTV